MATVGLARFSVGLQLTVLVTEDSQQPRQIRISLFAWGKRTIPGVSGHRGELLWPHFQNFPWSYTSLYHTNISQRTTLQCMWGFWLDVAVGDETNRRKSSPAIRLLTYKRQTMIGQRFQCAIVCDSGFAASTQNTRQPGNHIFSQG